MTKNKRLVLGKQWVCDGSFYMSSCWTQGSPGSWRTHSGRGPARPAPDTSERAAASHLSGTRRSRKAMEGEFSLLEPGHPPVDPGHWGSWVFGVWTWTELCPQPWLSWVSSSLTAGCVTGSRPPLGGPILVTNPLHHLPVPMLLVLSAGHW